MLKNGALGPGPAGMEMTSKNGHFQWGCWLENGTCLRLSKIAPRMGWVVGGLRIDRVPPTIFDRFGKVENGPFLVAKPANRLQF